VWQGFSQRQLGYFSLTQAAVITGSQYHSLDSAKQEVIRRKLSAIQADLLRNPVEDGKGSAGDVISPVSTAVLGH